jgi:short-subunit dehydrogenase
MSERPTAVITGASSGIGASVAKKLAQRKYDCVLTARRTDRLEALAKELEQVHQIKAHVITSDLGERGGAEKLIRSVADLGVTVDVLINNAGFGIYGNLVDQPADRVAQMIELNMTSLTTLTHHYAKEMVTRKRGHILQVSSIGAFQPSPLYAVYSATKSYVLLLSHALNYELKGTGVSVTTICPGLTATEFHEVAAHKKPGWMDMITMSADDVAEIGIRSMLKGRSVVVPGLANKITIFFVGLIPQSWATAGAAMSMRGKAS